MAVATHALAIDLDSSELFSESGESVIADVRGAPGELLISVTRGRDAARLLSPPRSLRAGFTLDNAAGTYDPSSTLAAGQQARWRMTFGGTVYDVLRGLIDTPEQDPRRDRHRVEVSLIGTLSRLIGHEISTALYEGEDIGTLIGHLLDAAAWPKNLHDYLVDLSPAGYWPLGETSGDALDASGNGNNGTVTIGAGSRDAAALDDGGDGCIDFDGAATLVSIADQAAIQNIFDGGGAIALLCNLDSDGELDVGRLLDKAAWYFNVQNEAAGFVRLNFRQGFSTTEGVWQSAVNLPISTTLLVVVNYNSSDVVNNPTLYVWDNAAEIFSTLTVGSGLTETSTPVGTRTTDVGSALVTGNNAAGSATADGRLGKPIVFSAAAGITAARAKVMAARTHDAPRHLDTGLMVPSFWWADSVDAFAALITLMNTEGPGAVAYEDGTGALVLKRRHAIVLEARSTAVQTTFRTAAGATEPRAVFSYDPGLRDAIKVATATVKTRTAKSLAVAWTGPTPVTLAPGETRTYLARTTAGDPMKAAVTPVLNTDYTVTAGSVSSVSLNRTSGASITITITAGASGATFTGLQLRAQAVTVDSVTQVSDQHANTGTNLTSYVLPVLAEIAVNNAQDFCDAVVGWYEDGRPRASLRLEPLYADARMTAALAREVHDRVRVIDPETNTDKHYYVHQKTLALYAPNRLVATLEVEAADAVGLPFILDTDQLDDANRKLWF